jgi:cytochrome b
MRTLTSFFGFLILVALIIRLIWWILGTVALVVLFFPTSSARLSGASDSG